MSTYLVDTFTVGSTTALSSHTADDGSTWSLFGGSGTPDVFSSFGGICAPGSQGVKGWRSSTISPSADAYLTGDFYFGTLTTYSFTGVMSRLNTSTGAGYLAGYLQSDSKWYIFLLSSGLTTTTICSSSAISYAANDAPTYAFTVTGTGASVAVSLTINGTVVCSGTDTSGTAGSAGYAGVFFNNNGAGAPNSGLFIGSITATDTAAALAFTAPLDGTVCQLSGGASGTATISTAGTYSVTAPDQWRLVQDGTNTAVTSFDWTSFTSTPSAGAFSQTISSVPKQAGWINVQVRNSGTPGTIYTSGKVGTGVVVVVDGQSPAWLWFSTTSWAGDSSLTPDALLRITGIQPTGAWTVPATATMNGSIACGNALVTACSCPVALVDGSWDGSGLTISANGGQWISGGAAGNAYAASAAAVTAAGGLAAATVWIQGEADAGSSVTQANYYTALGQLFALRRAAVSNSSLPYIEVTLARDTTATQTDTQRENIKLAQVQKCADANVYRVDRMDLPLYSDGVHQTAAGFTAMGKRVARAILAALGSVADYRGPSYSTVSKVSSSVYDVNLTYHYGSDITPTSGITGFRVLDSGTPATISSVTHGAGTSTIRITLSSPTSALPVVQYLYGTAPTITGVALDNSALTLPLEYNAGVTAVAAVWRPGSDISVSGWTGYPTTSPIFGNMAEATRDDSNYVTSPTLTSSSQFGTFGFDNSFNPSGTNTYTLTFASEYIGTSGQMRVNLCDSVGVLTGGTGSWQTLLATLPGGGAEYTCSYTISSACDRFQIEVKL